jgi:hypothetical protein
VATKKNLRKMGEEAKAINENTNEEDKKTMTQETEQKMTASERVNCSTRCTYDSN